MNSKEKLYKKLDENPVNNAGFVSLTTWWWLRHIFISGYNRPLKDTDVYRCLDEHKSKNLHNLFKQLWQDEKSRRTPSILRVFWKSYGPQVILWGLAYSSLEILNHIIQPQFLGYLLMYFSNESEISLPRAYFYASGIVMCLLVPVFTFHPFLLWLQQTAMKFNVGVSCLIYEKTLRLTKSTTIDGLSGKVINLLTNDMDKFDGALTNIHDLYIGPLEVFILGYFIYREIQLAGLIGIGFMLSFMPFQIWLGKRTASYRMKAANRTDSRVMFMNEIIQGIQVIKMYTWEMSFADMIKKVRAKEVDAIGGGQYIQATLLSLFTLSRVAVFLSIISYVMMGNTLSARKVFITSAYLSTLNDSIIQFWPNAITCCAEGYVSAQRLLQFLMISETKPEAIMDGRHHDQHGKSEQILMQDATGIWPGSADSGVISVNLEVKREELCVIIGPVASGKTSMLQAILGELELDSGSIHVEGSVSYAAQEPWLFEGSIRQNIIFIEDYDAERYQKVIKVCALSRDIELFPYGDETIVGERGISLSGGQKARVSLARAVYRRADIYLLDDPLSAVDAHVGRHIFNYCITEFLAGKICVLVTHQLQYLQGVQHIVLMNNGHCATQGTYAELKGSPFMALIPNEVHTVDNESEPQTFDTKETTKPEDLEEVAATGAVEYKAYQTYFNAAESKFWIATVILLGLAAQIAYSGTEYFISSWVNWEESLTELVDTLRDADEIRKHYMVLYTVLVAVLVIATTTRTFSFFYVGLRISKNLHAKMFKAITGATMYFFNTNSSGRILNRFSEDIGNVDTELPSSLYDVSQLALEILSVMVLINITNYWLLLPTIVLMGIMYFMRKVYVNTSRSIQRLESLSRSPIFTHTNATLNGLSTIRALNAVDIVQDEYTKLQDFNTSLVYLSFCTSRAFAFWLDVFCVVYAACVIYSFLLIDPENRLGGAVGLAITQSMMLIGMLQWGMRQTAELETEMIAVERIQEYIDIAAEPQADVPQTPNKHWPEQGEIVFENLSMKYSTDGEMILKNLNFTIKPQEKVGIVGRTGAGKSSIIQALFRLSPLQGFIQIDGINTQQLHLKDLRSKISIIPQDPFLFSGTLRGNLDPFDEYSDADIWTALQQVELAREVKTLAAGLNSKVSESGANFSMGQKQLVCLARAILRKNKILILDEATANIDPETDHFIQETIRNTFHQCTVLTIAHRLHTVMDSDRILVMEAGEIVEFGEPKELLQRENGALRQLAVKTGLTR